jgi:thiamine pyrophosphate-dependent acetolactate synthase large subunit-like protein
MTGARVFAQAGKDEGVAVTHAADAFIRMSGEIAVASGTEGPG